MRHLYALIHAYEAKQLDDIERVPSLRWVLLHRTLHNVHLLRRRRVLDHGKKLFLRVRSNDVT